MVDGLRTAAAVARGESQLLALAYLDSQGQPCQVTQDIAATLDAFGDRPRVYRDAVFARAVEICNDLNVATAAGYDDVGVMARLLDAHLPPAPQPAAHSGRASVQGHARTLSQLAQAYQHLAAQISAAGLERLYREVELPAIPSIVEMVVCGMPVNGRALAQITTQHTVQMEAALREARQQLGQHINLDRDAELVKLLYNQLALPPPVWTQSGQPSTSDEALAQLEGQRPVIPAIRRYRQSRVIRTAASAIQRHVTPADSRIHASLNPIGTDTGRSSCTEPNLQGVHRALLPAFCAPPGHLLLEADISQCELRVLAHFTQDPRLLAAFADPTIDLHRRTAATILNCSESAVTPEQRNQFGKELNFAVIYGMTAIGLSQKLGITEHEAQNLLDAYFRAYPGVTQWIQQVRASASQNGEVRTLYGRRRLLPDAIYGDQTALRRAVNTIVQGTAADLMKLALGRLYPVLPSGVVLLLTVHDSVLLEVPAHKATKVGDQVRAALETQPPDFTVPIRATIRTGHSWADCHG